MLNSKSLIFGLTLLNIFLNTAVSHGATKKCGELAELVLSIDSNTIAKNPLFQHAIKLSDGRMASIEVESVTDGITKVLFKVSKIEPATKGQADSAVNPAADTLQIQKSFSFVEIPQSVFLYEFNGGIYLVTSSFANPLSIQERKDVRRPQPNIKNLSSGLVDKWISGLRKSDAANYSYVQIWNMTGGKSGNPQEVLLQFRIHDKIKFAMGRFTTSKRNSYLIAFNEKGHSVYFMNLDPTANKPGAVYDLNRTTNTHIKLPSGELAVIVMEDLRLEQSRIARQEFDSYLHRRGMVFLAEGHFRPFTNEPMGISHRLSLPMFLFDNE